MISSSSQVIRASPMAANSTRADLFPNLGNGGASQGLDMTKAPKKPEDVKDEPGAEERFTRGVKRALATPPKPHDELKADKAKRRKRNEK